MNQQPNKFDDLKKSVRSLLEKFLSVCEFAEPVCEVENRYALNAAMEKSRQLRDQIANMEANETSVAIIRFSLRLVAEQSECLGLEQMAFKAMELEGRLNDHDADARNSPADADS